MATKHVGSSPSQGGIYIDRNRINAAFPDQPLDPHDKFLSAPHGEGWDDNLALMELCMGKEILRLLLHLFAGLFMEPISISRFKDQHVAGWRRFRIAKNGHVKAAEVPAKYDSGGIAAGCVFYSNGCRSQDMACIVK